MVMPLPTLRQVGDTAIQPKHRASCHCGGVVLELDLPDGVVDVRRCTCSMCRRNGAIMGAVPLAGLRIVQGLELLSVCIRCGKYR
jgi:hypothetical protein